MGSSASKTAKKAYPSAGAIARDNAVTFRPPPSTFPTPAARSSPADPLPSATSSSSSPGQLALESRPDGAPLASVCLLQGALLTFALLRGVAELARSGGRDPAFLSKLRELGQVTIQDGQSSFHGPQSVASCPSPAYASAESSADMRRATGRQSEPNAAQDLLHRRTLDPISFPTGSPTDPEPTEADAHNRLDAASLVALLEARRQARSPEDAQRVAARWNVDLALVDRLAAFVNPPTVGPDAVVEDDQGQQKLVVRPSSPARILRLLALPAAGCACPLWACARDTTPD